MVALNKRCMAATSTARIAAAGGPEGPRMAVMQEAARPRPAGTPDTPDTPHSTRFRLPRRPCRRKPSRVPLEPSECNRHADAAKCCVLASM
jgi:hypothetical protein